MNFNEDFEYYLQKKFEELELDYPHTVTDIVRHTDVNYIIPLKSELFVMTKLLKEVAATLRNGGYDDNTVFGKLYLKLQQYD